MLTGTSHSMVLTLSAAFDANDDKPSDHVALSFDGAGPVGGVRQLQCGSRPHGGSHALWRWRLVRLVATSACASRAETSKNTSGHSVSLPP